jgi:hypothetical protein
VGYLKAMNPNPDHQSTCSTPWRLGKGKPLEFDIDLLIFKLRKLAEISFFAIFILCGKIYIKNFQLKKKKFMKLK